ncbi:MAG: NAD(P)-dependent oxidoreductase [Deltaproteobacteria bacterium]|nr:NAD(P)-dependent oxidoreductase [Deltaproteobacteria bacterium]
MTTRTKWLITGGSGFLGINLVRYLLQRGYDIVNLDLVEFDYADCRERITSYRGDIRDRAMVDRVLEGVDIVVHAAAALPLYSEEEIFSTDIEGTRNVCDAAWRHGVRRLIHISSTAVYGIPDHHPLFETDRVEGVGPYGHAKVEAEAVCREYRAKGMCLPILRPKSFLGPERLGAFAMFYDWAREGRGFPVLGSGRNRYQFLDVEDLCEAIHLCATLDEARVNDAFNIGAKEFTTMGEDFQAVLDRAGFGKKVVPLPAWPAIAALRVLEFFHLSPLYKWIYETAVTDSFVSIEKAQRTLGFEPKHSNKDALLRNYEWYLEHLDNFRGRSGVSHRVPWKQGALGVAKRFF